jgi:VanZ family protein
MRLLRFWFPLWAYSAIIFLISSLPASSIGFTHVVWDKLLHTLEYTVLGFLAARAFAQHNKESGLVLWAICVVFCFGFGLTDEFHQSFVPGRESALNDAYADLLGGAIGAGIYLFIQQILIKFKKEKHHVSP